MDLRKQQERLNEYHRKLQKKSKAYLFNGDKDLIILNSIRRKRNRRLSQIFAKG